MAKKGLKWSRTEPSRLRSSPPCLAIRRGRKKLMREDERGGIFEHWQRATWLCGFTE